MAEVTTVRRVDDLDESSEADETVKFGLDGVQYEIDLTAKNAEKLRHALQPYLAVARPPARGRKAAAPGRAARSRRGGSRVARRADPEQNKAIREWAKSRKMDVADRGQIPKHIVDAYHASAGR